MLEARTDNANVSSPSRISGPNPVFEDSELVLGLVAPVGTNFDRFTNFLDRCLKKFGYATNLVRLSELTKNFKVEPSEATGTEAFVRSNDLMHAGNYLRFSSRRGEFLSLAAAQAIRATRTDGGVRLKTAHVLRSLKHPDEVRALRRIYGQGFYLIGITVNEAERRSYLQDDKGCDPPEVDRLLLRDEHEEDPRFIDEDGQNYGQRTRDTYQLADAFVPLDAEVQLERFLGLIFGSPFQTPTPDEYAMFRTPCVSRVLPRMASMPHGVAHADEKERGAMGRAGFGLGGERADGGCVRERARRRGVDAAVVEDGAREASA